MPTEIILMVADQLNDAGINALARTNSQMYGWLNEFLYRRDVTRRRPWSLPESLTWVLKTGVEADIYTNNTVEWAVYACRNLNPIPENFHEALQGAAEQGCDHLVERLLKVNGINPNHGGRSNTSRFSSPPLVLAALYGHSAVVKLLLATVNIDPNIRNPDPYAEKATPLHCACRNGHSAVVELLLAAVNIDPNIRDPIWNVTPLHYACRNGHRAVVEQLLARDDIDFNVNGHGVGFGTPLIEACYTDNIEIIYMLLAKDGIDVNPQDSEGCTALYLAASAVLDKPEAAKNRLEVVKLLLDREDIDVNLPDTEGRTPLFLASYKKNVSVVNLLLRKRGVDPNARGDHGRTPLAEVCSGYINDESISMARLLLSHCDTDPNLVDNNGVSALTKVRGRVVFGDFDKREEMVYLLRAAGAT
jgi:ankyrin repeat protein